MDDLALQIMHVKAERDEAISGYQTQMDATKKHYKKELDALYDSCDHSFSLWCTFWFKDGRQGTKRGCELCNKEEFLQIDRYVKESQE